MNLLALDLSLTSTGWAAKHGAQPPTWGTFKPKDQGAQRLQGIVTWLDTLLDVWKPEVVLVEGYSFGSQLSRAHALGELGGVVRLRLFQRAQLVVEVAPKTRAKFATGSGNAGKEQVLVEAVKRLGYIGHSNDEADALWLLQIGLQGYACSEAVRVPSGHMAALDAIEWPTLRRAS